MYETNDDYVSKFVQEIISCEEHGDKDLVLEGKTIPLASILKAGPTNLSPRCLCINQQKHISFFDALKIENRSRISLFCNNVCSFLTGRLPCWLTKLRLKKEFSDLPTVYNVFCVFERTFWFKYQKLDGRRFSISRELRLLLYASTGRDLQELRKTPTAELLCFKTSKAALQRIRNFFITLDGLMISLYLASDGNPYICNWKFFEKVMTTYINHGVFDLFYRGEETTYYKKLKDARGVLKNVLLKERSILNGVYITNPNEPKPELKTSTRFFSSELWFFDFVVKAKQLYRVFQTPESVTAISYLVQTRAAGLPPEPVRNLALKKFFDTVTKKPKILTDLQRKELSFGIRKVISKIITPEKYENLLDYATAASKVSLTDSACFDCPRSKGGKFESSRKLLNAAKGLRIPVFDLATGGIKYTVKGGDGSLTPGQELLFLSIATALVSLSKKTTPLDSHIGDIRVSTVDEPGKSRVITIPRLEHSIILHPLAHLLSEILTSVESTRAGLTKANHLWDFYKRIKEDSLIYKTKMGPRKIETEVEKLNVFLGSEDWTSATDSMNPYSAQLILTGLKELGLPKFYLNLCSRILTMPRRIYETDDIKPGPKAIKFSGVLQGDPLCKQVLHLSHLVSREVGLERLAFIGLCSSSFPYTEKDGRFYGAVPEMRKLINLGLPRTTLRSQFARVSTPGIDPEMASQRLKMDQNNKNEERDETMRKSVFSHTLSILGNLKKVD